MPLTKRSVHVLFSESTYTFTGKPVSIYSNKVCEPVSLTVYDRGNSEADIPKWYFQGLASEYPIKWGPLIAELGLNNERHLGFDPRGIGKSTGNPDSLSQIADDAARVLDLLKVEQVQVVGQSMGGILALLFASQHPDRTQSLVVIDSLPEPTNAMRLQAQKRLELIQKANGAQLMKRVAKF